MASDLTGEIRCPSCGRMTPLTPFCTHCGGVIPEGASVSRPGAMDREELEERARAMHGGSSSPFRRGAGEDAEAAGAWSTGRGPHPFVPEPSDELARRSEADAADQPAPPRVDHLEEPREAARHEPDWRRAPAFPAEPDWRSAPAFPAEPDWRSSGGAAASRQPQAESASEPPAPQVHGAEPIPAAAAAFAPRDEPPPYAPAPDRGGSGGAPPGDGDRYGDVDGSYDDAEWSPDDRPPRRSSALPILGFLVLGIAALLGGAVLFSALNGVGGVAQESATPSPTATTTAQPSTGATASEEASPGASASASADASLPVQPDNFSARVQPCATSKMSFKGCDKDGSQLTGDQVWVWVGFKGAQAANVLGVSIVSSANNAAVADGSVELTQIGCEASKPCAGYVNMTFGNLDPGGYTIQVTRDGLQVATTTFTVNT